MPGEGPTAQLAGRSTGRSGPGRPAPEFSGTVTATARGNLWCRRPCSSTPNPPTQSRGASTTDGAHSPTGTGFLRSQVPLPGWPTLRAPPTPQVLDRTSEGQLVHTGIAWSPALWGFVLIPSENSGPSFPAQGPWPPPKHTRAPLSS